jgi:homoserine kinase
MVGLKVFAPASIGNVGIGFDVLGLCLEKPGDEIIIKPSRTPGVTISKITGGKTLPLDPAKNTAGVAAQAVLNHLKTNIGVDLEIRKKMPSGSGLGSSAASAVAGAMAVNEFLDCPLTKKELLPFAMQGEELVSGAYHADNVAPSLLGGLILIRDNQTLDMNRIYTPKGLYLTLVYPHVEILTVDSRAVLSDSVPLKVAIQQSANLSNFILGMINSDFGLIARSLDDVMIEPQRAKLIPNFYEIKAAAMKAGAMGCSISGAGPTIFAMSENSLAAENIEIAMKTVYEKAKIRCKTYISQVNQEGAIRC